MLQELALALHAQMESFQDLELPVMIPAAAAENYLLHTHLVRQITQQHLVCNTYKSPMTYPIPL